MHISTKKYLSDLNEGFFNRNFNGYCYILEYKEDGFSYLLVLTKDENLQNHKAIRHTFMFTKENFQDLLDKMTPPVPTIFNKLLVVPTATELFGKFGQKVRKSIPNCKVLDKSIIDYNWSSLLDHTTITKFLGSKIFTKREKLIILSGPSKFYHMALVGNKKNKEQIKSNARIYLKESLSSESISTIILRKLVLSLIVMFMFIGVLIISTKRKPIFEKKLLKITGKNYIVRELNSDVPNAFCFGGFGKSIIYTKKLKELLNERELTSVFLHEIGHITSYDVVRGMLADLGVLAIFNYLLKHISKGFSSTFSIVAVSILLNNIQKGPSILLGKWFEYKADEYTVKYGYAKDLVASLEKLQKWSVDEKRKIVGTPTKLELAMDKINQILDVHPSVENRVKRLFSKNELYENLISKKLTKVKEIIHKTIMFDK